MLNIKIKDISYKIKDVSIAGIAISKISVYSLDSYIKTYLLQYSQ